MVEDALHATFGVIVTKVPRVVVLAGVVVRGAVELAMIVPRRHQPTTRPLWLGPSEFGGGRYAANFSEQQSYDVAAGYLVDVCALAASTRSTMGKRSTIRVVADSRTSPRRSR